LYYFYHEHIGVTSATLLPALVGFLSITSSSWKSRLLLVTGSLLVTGLSNPYITMILMPIGHAGVIWMGPSTRRREHWVRWGVFWSCYGLYYAPTVLSHIQQFAISNRSLFHGPSVTPVFATLLHERLLHPAILSPAAVLIALVTRRTLWATALMLAAVGMLAVLSAANQTFVVGGPGTYSPTLLGLSTLYYRFFYLAPVVMLVWAARLMSDSNAGGWRPYIWRSAIVAVFCYVVALPVSGLGHVFGPFWKYAVVLGLSLCITVRWARRPWLILIVGASVVLFSRYTYSEIWEVPFQGNLFVEGVAPVATLPTVRTVTVMSTCDAVDVYPAQALVTGQEVLDGISNFFDRAFAERWRHYVADNPALCTSRYAQWGTRSEVTLADVHSAPDRILAWLRINNVEFVRSAGELAYPELELIDKLDVPVDGYYTVPRFLYRLRSPVSRVFTVPLAQAGRATRGDLEVEEQVLHDLLEQDATVNVPLDLSAPSRLKFSGTFERSMLIVASVNFHPGWELLIDGQRSGPLTPGPFGMLSVRPEPGAHTYEFVFRSSLTWWVPLCMAFAGVLLWVGSAPLNLGSPSVRKTCSASQRRRAVVVLVGAVIAGSLAAYFYTKSAPPSAQWMDAAWKYRRAIVTSSTSQTAPVAGFPLRVEYSEADAAFWHQVEATGADLRFTDEGGLNLLPFELEEFDGVRKSLIAWVRLPELPLTAQTVAYLYFGNPYASPSDSGLGVWDSAYEAVWHLNPRVTAREGFARDSTGHGHHGQLEGGLRADPDDRDVGLPFGGLEHRLVVEGWPPALFSDGDWTMELRVKPAPLAGRNFSLIEHGPGETFNLYLHNEGFLALRRGNAGQSGGVSFARDRPVPDEWTSLAVVRAHNDFRLGLNGVVGAAYRATAGFTGAPVQAPLRLGTSIVGSLDGRLTEVRVSRGRARSADWIHANAASATRSFVKFGRIEQREP